MKEAKTDVARKRARLKVPMGPKGNNFYSNEYPSGKRRTRMEEKSESPKMIRETYLGQSAQRTPFSRWQSDPLPSEPFRLQSGFPNDKE